MLFNSVLIVIVLIIIAFVLEYSFQNTLLALSLIPGEGTFHSLFSRKLHKYRGSVLILWSGDVYL